MFNDNNLNTNENNYEALHNENYVEPDMLYKQIAEEKEKKDSIRRLGLTIGIPSICLAAISYVWSFIYLFVTVNIAGMTASEAVLLSQDPAMQQIIQIILSCLIFLLPFIIAAKCSGFRIDKLVVFEKTKKAVFLPYVLLGIGFCSFSNTASSYASYFLEKLGVRYEVNFGENPSGLFGFILSFIATAIVPALVEEFSFRGIVLGLLKKHGEGFALIVSSILFGVMHGNFEQIPFAILVGLILGYIYIKTKNIWACVIVHCVNNAVSVIFSYFENIMTANLQNVLYIVYLIISMMAAIIGILVLSNKTDESFELEKCEDDKTIKQKYFWFFTSWTIVLFFAINIIEAVNFFVI